MPIRPENRKRYPANWKEIRQQILERAKHRCEFCGVENYAKVKRFLRRDLLRHRFVKIILTIAHLDHTPENNNPSNLRALCQQCHNRYDAPMRAAGRKLRNLELKQKAEEANANA